MFRNNFYQVICVEFNHQLDIESYLEANKVKVT